MHLDDYQKIAIFGNNCRCFNFLDGNILHTQESIEMLSKFKKMIQLISRSISQSS
jgi:hypothetical protein